jgi:acyl carrier protein
MTGTRDLIRSFIRTTFSTDSAGIAVEDDLSFLDAGIVDSMRVLELVEFLESQFDITVEDSELVPENLDSIQSICRYLDSKGISGAG